VESPYYRELQNCVGGTHSSRWISVEKRQTWPSRDQLDKKELENFGNCSLTFIFAFLLAEGFHCTVYIYISE